MQNTSLCSMWRSFSTRKQTLYLSPTSGGTNDTSSNRRLLPDTRNPDVGLVRVKRTGHL